MRRRAVLFLSSWLLAMAPVGDALGAPVPAGAPSANDPGAPVTLPRSRQYDITSRINGQTYRIFISTPVNAQPNIAYSVVYVLDGNACFGSAASAETIMSFFGPMAPAIVVGIGYPANDIVGDVFRRRKSDLTPSPVGQREGGVDAFLRVIEEEVKPFVMARHRVDPSKQIFWGHSLAGLAVLRGLFRNPTAFSTFIMSSPSIWWNNREVLADEEAFSKRARAGDLQLKVLITSAGGEQYRGDDPKLLAEEQRGDRMIDNASELAARLAALNPKKITVVRTIFDGEYHTTAWPASLSRGLQFALSRTETTLAPEVLARYVGVYQMTPTNMITVARTPGGLTVERSGEETAPLYAESETEFFLKDEGFQITFERDSTGSVTGLVAHQAGTHTPAKKVK